MTLKYFDPLQTHEYHTHSHTLPDDEHINTTHTHTPCLMMGEVSLEMLPKNIMIQNMINSKAVRIC